ncbi:hypothetical protein B9Z19DRAFT_1082270 [Tuber borchii]|uniref:Uncharacterized protein n=1 Tax=Tuber borchii TaxID=42251 RepID=A0A2T6ZUR7_TUBBO|nr:hypothetical protein B9Z19DRAFT_1082270 [Tuber borchii]
MKKRLPTVFDKIPRARRYSLRNDPEMISYYKCAGFSLGRRLRSKNDRMSLALLVLMLTGTVLVRYREQVQYAVSLGAVWYGLFGPLQVIWFGALV